MKRVLLFLIVALVLGVTLLMLFAGQPPLGIQQNAPAGAALRACADEPKPCQD